MLHEFLSTQRAAIIARTRSKGARRRAPGVAGEELESDVPLFLDQLIDALLSGPGSSDAIGVSATEHGGQRLREGFTVAQVVHDYGGVCDAITELAAETKSPISADEFHALNRCLDDAIALAVTEYTFQRDKSIAAEGRERLGEVVHELRNSLASAMIAFDVLRTGKVGIGGSTASVLGRSLTRLAVLIDSAVAGVRLESGMRTPERISVRDFIEEVEVGASIEASARELTLAVAPVDPGVDVEVDRSFLAAAVSNLLNNAFKFSRRHGHVMLSTSMTEEKVAIEVRDECGGLPAGAAESLFSPFEQRGADRSGLGLGLSISRKSVEANGGTLSVRDMPGVGCVFRIELPRLSPGA